MGRATAFHLEGEIGSEGWGTYRPLTHQRRRGVSSLALDSFAGGEPVFVPERWGVGLEKVAIGVPRGVGQHR
jgi:hypothetical protein